MKVKMLISMLVAGFLATSIGYAAANDNVGSDSNGTPSPAVSGANDTGEMGGMSGTNGMSGAAGVSGTADTTTTDEDY